MADDFIPDQDDFEPDQPSGGNPLIAAAKTVGRKIVSNPMKSAQALAGMAGGAQDLLGTFQAEKFNDAFAKGTEMLGGEVAEGLAKRGAPVPVAATAGFVAQNAPYFMAPAGRAAKPLSMLEGPAQGFGRRALGFSKRFLNKPGAIEDANRVAQTALDEGVIRPFSGTEATLGRAEDLTDAASRGIDDLVTQLSASGRKAYKTSDVTNEIAKQLMPKIEGGDFNKIKRIVNQILETVKGAGKGGETGFGQAQELRQALKNFGANFDSQKQTLKSQLYKRAYGIVNKAMQTGAEQALGKGVALDRYLGNKNLYGSGKRMVSALVDKAAAEAGNATPGLRETAVAGAQFVAGHPLAAIGTIGAGEALKRMGAGTTASYLNKAAKTRIHPVFLKALLSQNARPRWLLQEEE